MSPEAQRIAIAEWYGWKWYRRPATGPWADKPMRTLYHPQIVPEFTSTLQPADMSERVCNSVFVWREGMVPDYLNDLNAIHEAEMKMKAEYSPISSRASHWHSYRWVLSEVVTGKKQWDNGTFIGDKWDISEAIHATAVQRAEALLRTIGRWEDDK